MFKEGIRCVQGVYWMGSRRVCNVFKEGMRFAEGGLLPPPSNHQRPTLCAHVSTPEACLSMCASICVLCSFSPDISLHNLILMIAELIMKHCRGEPEQAESM